MLRATCYFSRATRFIRDFNPETFEAAAALVSGDRNAWFRMVLGYRDMAASLVTSGATDANSFLAANGEIFAAFSKIHPFVEQNRAATPEPEYCRHLEAVVLAAPDAQAILTPTRSLARARGRQDVARST